METGSGRSELGRPNEAIRKGAEITLALLPNMLLRAPLAQEQLMSTRQKMDIRFAKFFSGQLSILVEDIQLSSTRRKEEDGKRIATSYIFSESTYEAMGHNPGRHRNMPQNTDLIIFLKKIASFKKSTGSNFCKNGSKSYQK